MRDWVWLDRAVIIAIHEMQLAEHGGGAGARNAGLLDSALDKPLQLNHCGEPAPDAAALAASYGYGISRNDPFFGGNKRTGFMAAELFLGLNGCSLEADDAACVLTMIAVAAGDITKEAFAAWLQEHTVSR